MKIIKYFFEFIFIITFFFIFKIIGYKNSSNLGSIIGKKIGPIFRSNKKILENLNNDFFIIDNLTPGNYSETLLTIYNRWGEIIFMTHDYGLNEDWWDGKTMFSAKPYSSISSDRDIEANELKTVSDGVYYYVFDVFNVAHNQKESFVGYVTIIK